MPSRGECKYRCIASSVNGLIKQVICTYFGRAECRFWAKLSPSEFLRPDEQDARIIDKLGLNISRFTRSRRKAAGEAPIHYIRHENTRIILTTNPGNPRFFDYASSTNPETGERVGFYRNVMMAPLTIPFAWRGKLFAYAIGLSRGKVRTRIEKRSYLRLKKYYVSQATKKPIHWFVREFYLTIFEPYGGVQVQLHAIKRAVNEARRVAGISGRVPDEAIPTRLRPIKVYQTPTPFPVSIPTTRELDASNDIASPSTDKEDVLEAA